MSAFCLLRWTKAIIKGHQYFILPTYTGHVHKVYVIISRKACL